MLRYRDIPLFYGTRQLLPCSQQTVTGPYPVSSNHYFSKICFSMLSRLRLVSQVVHSLQLLQLYFSIHFLYAHACYMPKSFYLPWFDLPNNSSWREKLTVLHFMRLDICESVLFKRSNFVYSFIKRRNMGKGVPPTTVQEYFWHHILKGELQVP